MLRTLLIGLLVVLALGRTGFDASAGPFGVNNMKCLHRNGYSFAIFRAYQQIGRVDPNVVANMRAAFAGGIKDVGAYIYPCVRCGNPAQQVIRTASALRGLPYNTIWLDVERQGWNLRNRAGNRQFLAAMFNEAPKHGKAVGIYTSSAEWSQIVGNDWTAGARFQLWWPRWDGRPNLNNFGPFAGWRRCVIKQYLANKVVCGVGIDVNFKH